MDQVGNGGSGTAVNRLAALPGRDLQAALATIDAHDLSGRELSLMLAAQARLLAWVQADMAMSINEFVHCPASAQLPTGRVPEVQQFASDELALILHVAPMTATKLVLGAVDLVERHPRLWAALSDGLIDTRKVAVVTTVCPDTDDALAAAVDDVLLSTAVRADGSTALAQTISETPGALRLRTQRVLSALDPSWTRAVRRETLARRRLVKGTYGPGIGVGFLGLYDIDATGMAAAYEHVNAIARGIKRLGDTRTLDQVRADTAIDLLTGGTPTPVYTATATKPATRGPANPPGDAMKGEERPDTDAPTAASAGEAEPTAEPPVATAQPAPRARADVDLIVHINTLADLADALRRGELVDVGGFGLVPADVAARLVKAAAAARPSRWCMTLVDDAGRVVEHVRTFHDPTKAMREFVNARDRHCRFPGCVVTAVHCDTDHTVAHEHGGATCPCNLAPLCRRHHRLKQAQGFDLTIDPDTNTARWTTPHTDGANAPPWRWTGRDDAPPF